MIKIKLFDDEYEINQNKENEKLVVYKQYGVFVKTCELSVVRDSFIVEIEKELKQRKEKIRQEMPVLKFLKDHAKDCLELAKLLIKITNKDHDLEKRISFYIKQKKYILLHAMFGLMSKYVKKNVIGKISNYDHQRDCLKILIKCTDFKNKKWPFASFWNTFDESKKRKQREDFRKIFAYYVWDEQNEKYLVTNLNQASKRKKFEAELPADFVKRKLIRFVKFVMKKNATDPIVSYIPKKKNYQRHIYISVFLTSKNLIYVGEAKESTRYRWGYGSGHLFEIFHYVTRGRKYNYPRQLTDLFTLLVGPESQVIFTLETDVLKEKIFAVEKAYQFFFDSYKEDLEIGGYLHESLSSKGFKRYKDEYERIEKMYKDFVKEDK